MITLSRRLKNLIRMALVSFGIGMPIMAYVFMSVQAYNAVSLPPLPRPRNMPTERYENVHFSSRGQNYQVVAFWFAGQPGAPVLITVHGYKGSRYDELPVTAQYHALGYNVLSVDLSDSAGDTVGNGRISMGYSERWDVLGAFDYLLARGYTPDQIGLVGVSMGAATVLLAAEVDPRIRAVWADSAYARADTELGEQAVLDGLSPLFVPGGMLAGLLISGDRLWEAAPITGAPDLAAHRQAVYLVHCDDDIVVPVHHGIELYHAFRAAGVNVTFWQVPGGEHAAAIAYHQAEYLRRFDTFFRQTLVRTF